MDTSQSADPLVHELERAGDLADCEARIIADYFAEGDTERANRHVASYVAARAARDHALTALQQHIAEYDEAPRVNGAARG